MKYKLNSSISADEAFGCVRSERKERWEQTSWSDNRIDVLTIDLRELIQPGQRFLTVVSEDRENNSFDSGVFHVCNRFSVGNVFLEKGNLERVRVSPIRRGLLS